MYVIDEVQICAAPSHICGCMGSARLSTLLSASHCPAACNDIFEELSSCVRVCRNISEGMRMADVPCPRNIQAAKQVNECSTLGGICRPVQDGFCITSYTALLLGVPMLLFFRKALPRIEALPPDSWRSKTVHRQA